jgi:hypothetical protein
VLLEIDEYLEIDGLGARTRLTAHLAKLARLRTTPPLAPFSKVKLFHVSHLNSENEKFKLHKTHTEIRSITEGRPEYAT